MEVFTSEPSLRQSQFNTYLTDFFHPKVIKITGCKCSITEDKMWEMLKMIGTEKAPRIDGLPHEAYFRLLSMLFSFASTNVQQLEEAE